MEEPPDYQVLETRESGVELRAYAPMIVAETTVSGDPGRARNEGFRRLAAYIFAQSRGGERIAMTAPVTQARAERIATTAPVTQSVADENAWTIRFVMPSKYTMATLPAPGPGVTLTEMPPVRMAAIRFPGVARDPILADKTQALRAAMAEAGWEAAGEPVYAFYDAPFKPGFLRRNEVMIPVGASDS